MKRIHYNYLRPPHYYSHLFTFVSILAIFMGFGFTFRDDNFDVINFILKVIVFLFLFLSLAVIIEFFHRGEYIRPLILYDLLGFTNRFLEIAQRGRKIDTFFLTYDQKSKKNFKQNFSKKQYYFISTIKKEGENYKVSLINEKKLFQYFFIKFFVRNAIHTLDVQHIKGSYKIVRFK